jgi:PAS domain S-box-containing protein
MSETILIIDDDSSCRSVLKSILAPLGYAVKTATTVKAGWRAFRGSAVPIVLASFSLADDSVVGLIDRIRQADPNVEIVLMAQPKDLGDALRRLKHHVSQVIGRPVNPDELELALRGAARRIELFRQQADIRRQLEERIETERFLTVKQIVDKLSTFIGEIARNVEGGVKYFHEMPYFVAIHDRNSNVVAANRAYRTILGKPVGGKSWEVYAGASAQAEACPVGKTLQSGNAWESREVLAYRSGAHVPVIVHTAPIYNDDGDVELVLEVSAGTADVDKLRKELQTSQHRYEQLFDAVPCFVSVLDRQRRFTAINRLFKDEFGDRTGADFFDLFMIRKDVFDSSPIHLTYSDGRPHQGEMVLLTNAGKRFDMMVWTAPLATAAGKLLNVLMIFLDVTQIRDLQSNLASLGLMIGSISHSIKGVLTGLDAGVYLLDKGLGKNQREQIAEGLDVVKLMTDRIRHMIFDILFYAKERELKPERVEVAGLAQELSQIISPKLAGSDVHYVVEIPEECGQFEVDPVMLRSAVINVLENAVDACLDDCSGKDHTIRFRVLPSEDVVHFVVEDTGIGMNAEQLKKLFTIFFSTKGIRGTGLGLFITDKIIRQHGGAITVASTEGEGTRFCLQLPRRPSGLEKHSAESMGHSVERRALEGLSAED